MTNISKKEYPNLTLLSNNTVAAFTMDVAPSGGPYYAMLNKDTLAKYPECIIFWDPFAANSIFYQTELTKEQILQDTAVTVVEKYRYWSVEYLLLHRNSRKLSIR